MSEVGTVCDRGTLRWEPPASESSTLRCDAVSWKDVVTILYWVCAIGGVGLLALSMLVDGLLDGLLEGLSLDADGPFSLQVVAAFLGAFGIVGLAADAMGASTGVSLLAAVGAGVVLGWAALLLTRSLTSMRTDPTPTSGDLLGRPGRVVTPIGAASTGEVLVRLGGQPQKLSAAAAQDLELGTQVRVVEVVSSTRVRVVADTEFWNDDQGQPDPRAPRGEP